MTRRSWLIRIGAVLSALFLMVAGVLALRGLLEAKPDEVLRVRVTVYWAEGEGTDAWSSKGMSATGEPLVDRKSAAVDPRRIPYGSTVVLPQYGLRLRAVDTGKAIQNQSASKAMGENVPVVDVFFQSRKQALRWAKERGHFTVAYIYHPKKTNRDNRS